MFFKRKKSMAVDPKEPLSAQADQFLEAALAEFNRKQAALNEQWQFDNATNWGLDQGDGVFRLDFDHERQLQAEAQILGSYAKADLSFEWAWNNPHVHKRMKRDSNLVKKLGKRLGIEYLQVGIITVPDDLFLSYLGSLGLKATESDGLYRGSADSVDVLLMLKNIRLA